LADPSYLVELSPLGTSRVELVETNDFAGLRSGADEQGCRHLSGARVFAISLLDVFAPRRPKTVGKETKREKYF